MWTARSNGLHLRELPKGLVYDLSTTIQGRIPLGPPSLDCLLSGGLCRGEITLVYGEANTGKTTTVIQVANATARTGLKTIYIDCDHSFTQQRFNQIAGNESKQISELINLFLPETFSEQRTIIESLENYVTPSLGVIVVDSMSSLYRASFSDTASIFSLNRDLSRQLAYLSELTASHKIACVVTSQVHARLKPPAADIEPVARRTILHFPRTILRLKNTPKPSVKEFILERADGVDVGRRSCLVRLSDAGLVEVGN